MHTSNKKKFNNAEEIGFECVRPVESHAKLIMHWRNDPETLQMSFHSQPKVWDTFYQEFLNQYFQIAELPPLFVLYHSERVAFLRFRPYEHPSQGSRRCCDISIIVSPDWRHHGVASKSLEQVREWAANQGFDDMIAEIKESNEFSNKAFLNAKFEFLDSLVKHMGSDGMIPILRYIASLTPTKKSCPVFIIAEAGSNWRSGSPEKDWAMAKRLIDSAAEAGADAVKFQVFRPETMYVPNAGSSGYLSAVGIKNDIGELFAQNAMPYEMIPRLSEYCHMAGVQFLASTFSKQDFQAVDPFVKIHKIASYEITHPHLIELAARSGKPLLLSTAAAIEEEIDWAVNLFIRKGGKDLTLLQCTARYPAEMRSLNLKAIPWLKRRFKVRVGLSDHSLDPICGPVGAVVLGAEVIEKHFTMDKSLNGPDHAFALNPKELKQMVTAIREAEQMGGSGVKIVQESEKELRSYCFRGIQAIDDIQEGDLLIEGKNIAILRAGKQTIGLHPKWLAEIEGKTAKRNILLGSGLQKGDW